MADAATTLEIMAMLMYRALSSRTSKSNKTKTIAEYAETAMLPTAIENLLKNT
ncbi:MAG: hypothetical protein JRN15_07105 [Nitrososphaerota archaeon]|nr:hypothetical protein [Nitrososphaerota archaeon]